MLNLNILMCCGFFSGRNGWDDKSVSLFAFANPSVVCNSQLQFLVTQGTDSKTS